MSFLTLLTCIINLINSGCGDDSGDGMSNSTSNGGTSFNNNNFNIPPSNA